jgi:cold-inducible RNA-binding protein
VGTKLYVGNLNYNTNEASLREAFGANGREVTSVSIIMDRETGRSRGFAFVEMATPEGAQAALAELDGHEVDGRQLRINEARERDARGPGGPGGAPRPYTPRPPGGGYGSGPGGPPSGGGYRPPGGPPSGGFGGPPRSFGGPPSGGPARNFGANAPPAGTRRGGKEKEKEKDGGGADVRKKGGRKRAIDGDDW